jgi:hypothetical protein
LHARPATSVVKEQVNVETRKMAVVAGFKNVIYRNLDGISSV